MSDKDFSLSDIDTGLLVSLVHGLQIHLQVFLSDIDVGLTVSLLYILLIHSQFFYSVIDVGLTVSFFYILEIHFVGLRECKLGLLNSV